MCVLIRVLEGPTAFRICQRTPIDCPADRYMIEMPKPTPKCPLAPLQERRACMLECIMYILHFVPCHPCVVHAQTMTLLLSMTLPFVRAACRIFMEIYVLFIRNNGRG